MVQSIRWSLVAFLCCGNTVKVKRGRETGLRTGPSTDCYPYPSSITWSPLALTQNILIVFIHPQTPLSLLIHGHPALHVRKPLYVHVLDPSVETFIHNNQRHRIDAKYISKHLLGVEKKLIKKQIKLESLETQVDQVPKIENHFESLVKVQNDFQLMI